MSIPPEGEGADGGVSVFRTIPARAAAAVLSFMAFTTLAGCAAHRRGAAAAAGGPVSISAVDLEMASGPDVAKLAHRPGARAVLVNVWATWCEPCREEFPDILRVARQYRGDGLRVVLVSGDFPTEEPRVRQFLADHGVDFTTYLKSGKDMEFVNGIDSTWSGTLPATWVYDGKGIRRAFWGGKAGYDDLNTKIREVLGTSREDQAQ